MRVVWETIGHVADSRDSRELGSQRAHLFGPYWATIGPHGHTGPRRWSWTVFRHERPDDVVTLGFAYDEADAKNAVLEWARPRAPRSLRRRLRARTHR